MEGRPFILGRNGFYNKTIEILKKKNIYQIYFILLFKNETEEEMKNSIENLMKKGDQKELEYFMDNNQIIYLNESTFKNNEKREKLNFFLSNKILFNFFIRKNFEIINKPFYEDEVIKDVSKKVNDSIDNNLDDIKINLFYNKFKKYLDNNIYYDKDKDYFDDKYYYNDKNEILEKLKCIKILQNYLKEKNGDNNSPRFNCEIL